MVPGTSLRYQEFLLPPGELEKDFWYAFDLLRNPKDHVEFTLVRDFVRDALLEVCSQVKLDTEKSVLKQAAVQHLYGRLSGILKPHANDAQLLVSTPLAVRLSHRAHHWVHSCITRVLLMYLAQQTTKHNRSYFLGTWPVGSLYCTHVTTAAQGTVQASRD